MCKMLAFSELGMILAEINFSKLRSLAEVFGG